MIHVAVFDFSVSIQKNKFYYTGISVRCSTACFCLVQAVAKQPVTQERTTLFIKENKAKNVLNKV